MAIRGRTPLPAALHRLNGNPGRRELREEPATAGPLVKPDDLDDEASDEWDRAVAAFPPGFYTAADGPTLAVYCEAWVQFQTARAEVRESGILATGGQGQVIANPAVGILKAASDTILKAGAVLGMSPAARARMATPAGKKDEGKFSGLLGGKPLKVVTSSAPGG
jgi:P27 family predicted phage terminase small subunit